MLEDGLGRKVADGHCQVIQAPPQLFAAKAAEAIECLTSAVASFTATFRYWAFASTIVDNDSTSSPVLTTALT